MAGQMPGMAVVAVAAITIVVIMRGDLIAIAAVMITGACCFNGGRGRAKQMRQRCGEALQGHHQQQHQHQNFSAKGEHGSHSIVKKLVMAILHG